MLYELRSPINNQTFFFLRNTPDHFQLKPKKGIKKEKEELFKTSSKEEISKQLPFDIQEIYTSLWEEFDELKMILLEKMVYQWGQENFSGRIKRIIEQTLQKKF